MAVTFFPGTDAKLLAWSLNFSTLITAGPTTYGLTTAQASTYRNLHNAYATALAACDPSMRTKMAVATKNTARNNLKANARLLANLVNGTASVTNAQKLQLGLTVKAKPTPIPPPSAAPALDVMSVSGWTVKVKLHDAMSGSKRGKPAAARRRKTRELTAWSMRRTEPADRLWDDGFAAWEYAGVTSPSRMALAL